MTAGQPFSQIELRYETLVRESPAAGGRQMAVVTLNRPKQANAFNAQMIDELTEAFGTVNRDTSVRLLLLNSRGKHFSAGADLNWMRDSAKLSLAENHEDAAKLISLFDSLNTLKVPTVALVKGAAYGGAVGLAAACDIAIARESARFCLSEAKLGLLPAVIVPYLARKMQPGCLRRLGLTAEVFAGSEALKYGLVQKCVAEATWQEELRGEIDALLRCGQASQTLFKSLLNRSRELTHAQGQHTAEAIAKARTSAEGQEGLKSFFEKRNPNWICRLPDEWTLDETD